MLATQISEQLRPISFPGLFFAAIPINKGFLRSFLFGFFCDTIKRKRPNFESLPHFEDKQKVTSVASAVNLTVHGKEVSLQHLISEIFSFLSKIEN